MSRSIRIEYAGTLYHVMERGNRRDDIFFYDDDRRFFIKTMSDACERPGQASHCMAGSPGADRHTAQMKSSENVSQQLRRLRDATRPQTTEYRAAAEKLSEIFD